MTETTHLEVVGVEEEEDLGLRDLCFNPKCQMDLHLDTTLNTLLITQCIMIN